MARTQLNPVADQAELLPVEIPPAARHPKVRMITRSEIFPDPEQPREAADAELRNLLAREGMLQPITVRPHPTQIAAWMIVDGERRWRSAEGVLNDLPCIVRGDLDDSAARLALQLTANSGKPLSPLEEARAFGKLLQETGGSVADVAKRLGRAPSTVAERVALLELGPWLPAIEGGALVMSHAVKVLLPLRSIADELHAKVVEQMYHGDFSQDADDHVVTLEEFRRSVMPLYKPFLYPLTKSKHYGAKNPEFNTSKHDAECGCGGIKVSIGYEPERLYCGNPEWWKPLEREAKKAAKAKEAKSAKSPGDSKEAGKTLYLPAVAKKVNDHYGNAPRGVTQLTNSAGEWSISASTPFDPADLVIDEKKLVYWKSYGTGFVCVGTKDEKAVAAALTKWAAKFAEVAEAKRAELRTFIQQQRVGYHIDGLGTRELAQLYIGSLWDEPLDIVADVAQALELPRADELSTMSQDEFARWAREHLSAPQAAELLTGIVVVMVQKAEDRCPSRAVKVLERKELDKIRKRPIPWKTKPKAEKPAKGAKAKAGAKKSGKADSKLPLSKLSTETAELPLADDPLATFRDEEAELTLADERAAAGAFDEDEEDEAPGVGAGWDDDSDDLWDDADELEEATG